MKHTFILPGLKPFSVNASYVRTFNGVSKSSGASEFCSQIFNIMSRESESAKLKQLREAFDVDKHAWSCSIVAYYPHSEYFTKKSQVSSKTIDLSNGEKLIIDCFFLPKFHTEAFPQGAQNLNSDDRYIVDLSSKKRPAESRFIEVTIEIVDKPAANLPE